MKTDQLNHLLAIFAVSTLAIFAIFTISVTMCIDIAAAQTEEEIEWLDAGKYPLHWENKLIRMDI